MIVDTKIRELLIELRNMLEIGVDGCFAIMSMCKNCPNKCNREKKKRKIKERIDNILC